DQHRNTRSHFVVFGIADAQPRDVGDEVAFSSLDHDDEANPSDRSRKETGMIVRRILCIAATAMVFAVPSIAAPLARHHAIVTDSPFATDAGLQILRAGGSAVDAAIAAQAMLTLVEPESTGIGGGAFMVLFDPAQKKVTSFD